MVAAPIVSAEPPALNFIDPNAVRPGQSVDVTLRGGNLAGPTVLWTNFSATASLAPGVDKNGTLADRATYRVTVPADVPLGVGALRVATGQGVSSLRLVLVDDLPSVAETADNKSPAKAQPLTLPVAVDGACDAEQSDFFSFQAEAGQRVSAEVVARRLGYPTDSIVRLLDSAGRELAFSDDDASIGVDSRLSHQFTAAGQYMLEVRDVRYLGSEKHRYRLRIGDFPLVAAPLPLAVLKGTEAALLVTAVGNDEGNLFALPASAAGAGSRVPLAVHGPRQQGSAWLCAIASDAVEQLEREPNDAADKATPCSLPGAVNGRLKTAGDVDVYRFQVGKGQRMIFATQSREFGSPCDVYLRVLNPDGSPLAVIDPAGGGELDVTFPADGQYLLRVEDLNGRGGAEFVYRVVARPFQPSFSLTVEGEKFDVPQGGVFKPVVKVERRDYAGDISLTLDGVPESVNPHGLNIMPANSPAITATFRLPTEMSPGHMAQVRVVGRATIDKHPALVVAGNMPALRGAFSGLPFPPIDLDGKLAVGVGPPMPRFFQLVASPAVVSLSKLNVTASAKITATRSAGFDGPILFVRSEEPAEVTVGGPTFAKGVNEGSLDFLLTKEAWPGTYPVRIVAKAEHQNQPQEFTLDTISLRIGPTLDVMAAPAEPIAVGTSQKLLVKLDLPEAAGSRDAICSQQATRSAEGPRSPALAGFESDNRAVALSGADKSPSDDRIVAAPADLGGGDYSVELWLLNARDLSKGTVPSVSACVVSRPGKPDTASAVPGDHLIIGGGDGKSPRDTLSFFNGKDRVAGRTALPIDTWHHVVLVRQGDVVTVYLDGETASPELQAKLPKNFGATRLVFGTRADDLWPLHGRLDEIAVYSRALAPEQVQAHFQAAKAGPSYSQAVLKDQPLDYWRLNETGGPTAVSQSPAANQLPIALVWKNLPPGVTAPAQAQLTRGQKQVEVELSATSDARPGKHKGIVAVASANVEGYDLVAESPPFALEIVAGK